LPEPTDDPVESNRRLWDEWAKFHVGSEFYDVKSFIDGTRPNRIADYEREEVGSVEGKTLLHLQCHFGMDTLSWARLGAHVTGADFSAEAIAAARKLATDVGIEATFVESNVYDLPDALHGEFDIVYTSNGVLGWLPRIASWAEVAAHFVKPGGFLYITEVHPVAQVFADENVQPGELRLHYPYWEHADDPIKITIEGSYAGAPTAGWIEHGWDHSMGEIVTSLVDAGLRIDFLHEFDFVNWPVKWLVRSDDGRYRLPADAKGQLPLFFSLRASKPK
jgi:SAM-dependent methyltransferase